MRSSLFILVVGFTCLAIAYFSTAKSRFVGVCHHHGRVVDSYRDDDASVYHVICSDRRELVVHA